MEKKIEKEKFPDEISSKYEIIQEIGRGAFSIVYKVKSKEDKKLIIRGDANSSYHKDIYRKFIFDIMNSKDKELKEDYDYECIGGGRIEFRPDCIFIYGYSSGYGQADHSKTKEIVKKFYPNYKIEISDEGY